MAANVDHRVDSARSAMRPASRHRDAPLCKCRLRLGRVVPVVLGSHQRRPSSWSRHIRVVFTRTTGLDQQHSHRGICGQAIDDHASGRAGADDDVVGVLSQVSSFQSPVSAFSPRSSVLRLRSPVLSLSLLTRIPNPESRIPSPEPREFRRVSASPAFRCSLWWPGRSVA
jgi:hypothetical protein